MSCEPARDLIAMFLIGVSVGVFLCVIGSALVRQHRRVHRHPSRVYRIRNSRR